MSTESYPTDVADEQWRLLEPLIPVYLGGRPRKTGLRDGVDLPGHLGYTQHAWRGSSVKILAGQVRIPERRVA